jgi:hypothetical protein
LLKSRHGNGSLWQEYETNLPSAFKNQEPSGVKSFTGAHNSHVPTLVERHSRFVRLVKVPSKDTATVVAALGRHVRELSATLRRTPRKRTVGQFPEIPVSQALAGSTTG